MLFLIASVVLLNMIAFLMPKRISRPEIWTTMLFASLLEVFTDVCLDLKLDWYGYFGKGFEWVAIIPAVGLYPSASTIFLNYYPFDSDLIMRTLYITGWSVFCIIFEFVSLKSGYFYYNGWQLLYSILCYPVLLCILVWNLKYIRRLNKGTNKM